MNHPEYSSSQNPAGHYPPPLIPHLDAPYPNPNIPPNIGFITEPLPPRRGSYYDTSPPTLASAYTQKVEDFRKRLHSDKNEKIPNSFNTVDNKTYYSSLENITRTLSPSKARAKKSPTVIPAHPFRPLKDAETLRVAMKGLGTDEKTIINVLTKRTNLQRQEIAAHFYTLYGKDLIKELRGELGGNLAKTVIAMMTPVPQFYAKELYGAIAGLGTDEIVLIEVLCTSTNAEIRAIKEAYKKLYRRNLENDLKGDTSGHFKRLLVSLCRAERDESMVTNLQAATFDAKTLFNGGGKRWGTDEATFNEILCLRNYAQLRLVFQEYHRLTGHDIEKAIKSEFSGDLESALLALVRSVKNQAKFFAQRLHKCMKGFETNYSDLIRIVVTRCEIDMGDIKQEFKVSYKEALPVAIKHESSGDYRKCLFALMGEL